MADKMMGKFNKYWSVFVLILAISVILDPRYVSFCGVLFKECYPETSSTEIMKVRCKLFSLFDEYADKITTASSCSKQVSNKSSSSHENAVCGLLKKFDTFQSESPDIGNQKTQLELYLDAPRVDRNYKIDVLNFWKAEQFRYPQVAAMARDVLAIPISTVASESAFSMGGRILD